jgi:hypothetical protein
LARALGNLAPNRGVEALASLPDGGIVALAESRDASGLHRMAVLGPAGVALRSDRSEAGFGTTAADRLGAHLLVPIVVLDAAAVSDGQGVLRGPEIARLDTTTISETFEGIAATREAEGTVLLYLISADNFSPLQRTLLVQLRWQDGPR